MIFDSSCDFLLGLPFDNLFEPVGRGEEHFRCKGCQEPVERRDRERHYARHKSALQRVESKRQERISRERRERLAKAREARQ